MKLTTEQLNILNKCEIIENKVNLPLGLDRKLYLNIAEVFKTIGIIWNKKAKTHIAEGLNSEELENAISDIIETGEVETLKNTIKKFQFYPTPKEVAEYLVELADIQEDDEILEPSAGDGAIIKVILEKYPAGLFKLYANEINRERYLQLLDIVKYVYQFDFLSYEPSYEPMKFDKVIMNPPFAKSQDVKHILKAYSLLNNGGRIVSIASQSIQTRQGKLYDELRSLDPEFLELPKGSFESSGTMVNTCIVIINK